MRVLLCAACVAALSALPQTVRAQNPSPSVNQRMASPTSQSDNYLGVSLGQLMLALGLTLKGEPPSGLDDIRLFRPRQTATAPSPASTETLLPAAAAADKPLVPVGVDQPVNSPKR